MEITLNNHASLSQTGYSLKINELLYYEEVKGFTKFDRSENDFFIFYCLAFYF